MKGQIIKAELSELKIHQQYRAIYGDVNTADTELSIKSLPNTVPVVVNRDLEVLSNNKLVESLKQLAAIEPESLQSVQFQIEQVDCSQELQLTYLLESMADINKTDLQRLNEGLAMEKHIRSGNGQAILNTLNQSEFVKDDLAVKDFDKGYGPRISPTGADAIATKVGLSGKGRAYNKCRIVAIAIQKFKDEGRHDDASILSELLSLSRDSAHKAVQYDLLDQPHAFSNGKELQDFVVEKYGQKKKPLATSKEDRMNKSEIKKLLDKLRFDLSKVERLIL